MMSRNLEFDKTSEPYLNLINCRKNLLEAVKCFDKAISLNPHSEKAYFHKAQTCDKLSQIYLALDEHDNVRKYINLYCEAKEKYEELGGTEEC
jgi:tetratricopeptide (TPR) repeat protein